ncbi:glycosyltransferase family 4 protein [Candidatus Pacearchaeota archaeon]|nr:glycosyltransferase family 4 protein [Candidatus Pacearchaeota archaeon]
MRILLVTPSYFPILGGTETFVQQLANELNKKGIQTDVMTFNMNQKWAPNKIYEIRKEHNFSIFRIPAVNPNIMQVRGHTPYRELFNVHVIPTSHFTKKYRKYDLVHFHDDGDLSFPFFSRLTDFRKKPNILHCHSLPYTHKKYKNSLSGLIFKKMADLYIGLSSYTIRLLLDLGLPKSQLAILPNAVDINMFKHNDRKKTDNIILYAARINRAKGLDVLLKALFLLEIQTQLIIIGPVEDRLFFSEIKNLIKKINDGTKHNVTIAGQVSLETLINLYQRAAIFACPSVFDHMPITNLEALACGTPVVATKTGAIPDVVKDGLNGLLVPTNDSIALASALQKLLLDKKSRESYGRKGREIVEKHFSWNIILRKMIKIYERLY